jgi:ABC-type sugar transport system ATPase subunit
MDESLRLECLSKSYGAIPAVADVNLQVQPGELLVLLGPSGCGKTTVLRLIAGLAIPDSGTIWMGTSHWNEVPPRDRNVAMVFQGHALYPHRTVRGNIEYPLVLRRMAMAERNERVQGIAQTLHIEHVLDRYPRTLSGGESQRAALARALVRAPACFLLDEPVSSLDPQLRLTARVEIKRLQRALGVLTLYVTHEQEEAIAVGDRIAIMNMGRILQVGTALDLLKNPTSTFVAGFFGNPPMNLLPAAAIGEADGNIRVRLGEFTANAATRWWPTPQTNLILGIRPKDVDIHVTGSEHRMDDPSVGEVIMLPGTVSFVEGVEPDYVVHCETLAGPVRVRTGQLIEPGTVFLRLPLKHVLFFDPRSGSRINEG